VCCILWYGSPRCFVSVSHVVALSVGRPTRRAVRQLDNFPINQPIDQSIHRPNDPTTNRSIMSPISRVQSAVYTQSPLRNITTQDDQPPEKTASSITRQSRSSRRISLRDAISNVLGSGVPVELLPNPPRRASSLSNQTSNTSSPTESRRSSGASFKDTIPPPPHANTVDPPLIEVAPDVKMQSVSWTIDDAVYATPAGKGRP